ncbi:histidine kinase [Halopseudomonas oceani]|uniref:histidine kinase n=1 Tax=Halopseudomonas oceani TaxID=1708783 RepID=A0A2P4ESS4_9GAMM|nr:HAMP domain-containing sensor histidine kinase [Halopseudomonas oceani]POB02195.1 histidine kinase [Halopseudomonas oceani]GGE53205.1 histidine kinase [Halopseudomonas oceani]
MSEQPEEQSLDFSTVIASTVHDMKNSLGLLMQSYGQLVERLPANEQDSPERGVIEYEFLRLNGMLVQMLGLYKLGVNQLPLRPSYLDVEEFLEDQLARHDDILRSRHIQGSYEVDEFGLMGFFDAELVGSVVGNVINNAIRYTRSAIHLRAGLDGEQLVITISDDGSGYPAAMLENQSDYILGINMSTGSTGLGLYFGGRIAQLHQRSGITGRIALSNGGELGGGEFRIWLP